MTDVSSQSGEHEVGAAVRIQLNHAERRASPARAKARPHIALFLQALNLGGAERAMLILADALVRNGCNVDLVLVVRRGELLAEVPQAVRLIELGTVSRTMLLPIWRGYRCEPCGSCCLSY